MLVLTRQVGESIVIDGGIVLTVVAVSRDKVRIGIQAPSDVRVDRKEVYLRRLEEEAAAKTAPAPDAPVIRPSTSELELGEVKQGKVATSV